MFKVHLGDTPHALTERDFSELGAATEGFSGSDVAVVVKDVLMQPIRLLREATHFRPVRGLGCVCVCMWFWCCVWVLCVQGEGGREARRVGFFL